MSDKELALLGDRMDRVDGQLADAEVAGNVSEQIVALRERSLLWREYGRLLNEAGRDSHGASLAAQRDEYRAEQLGGAR